METEPEIFGITGASRYIKLSECYTRQLADAGKITCARTESGRRVFRREDLQKFLSEREPERLRQF